MSGRGHGITWLASYPSSGNTWVRIFLANLLRGAAAPVGINTLREAANAASRSWFDAHAAVDSSDLTSGEIDEWRSAVYKIVGATATGPYFLKIHDALRITPSGETLISRNGTRSAVYIIRNPLDVAAAFAHHRDRPIDVIIRIMNDPEFVLGVGHSGLMPQLPQHLGSWRDHVRSWVDAPDLDVHVVRYEDMKARPHETFGKLAAFCELSPSADELDRAIRFSDFNELRRQEEAEGFRERSRRARRFFRRGVAGSWRDELTAHQAAEIVRTHGEVMKRFGYLDDDGAVTA